MQKCQRYVLTSPFQPEPLHHNSSPIASDDIIRKYAPRLYTTDIGLDEEPKGLENRPATKTRHTQQHNVRISEPFVMKHGSRCRNMSLNDVQHPYLPASYHHHSCPVKSEVPPDAPSHNEHRGTSQSRIKSEGHQ
ncbi:hypothetical protein E2C01_046180 [Portunus trituberculatus]|uniref:Uncharacterized protein n=1 Tax=Portunus trituberculatus TaxID=210409 RepID=A0A5B7G4D3_PORTR|nr:hypothetical protein [Portunus trituberculatus]